MPQLNWMKCTSGNWCDFLNIDLSHSHFDGLEGVYIVWHGGENPKCVRVGQGIIRNRLAEHQKDSEILRYGVHGLHVTWAPVSKEFRDGVENFLGQQLLPLVGSRFPEVSPIAVNFPW